MLKRGLCCGPVSVRLSVCLSRACILSRRLKYRQTSLSARYQFSFMTPSAGTQFQGNPSAGRKIEGGGEILRFSTEIAGYLGNGTR